MDSTVKILLGVGGIVCTIAGAVCGLLKDANLALPFVTLAGACFGALGGVSVPARATKDDLPPVV